ncbi:MAG: hypothetical protein ACRDI2_06330 [Chloroflexota bacterium]
MANIVEWFAAAAGFLHRADLRCETHHIPHTGKLARSIVLDLALLDVTGDERYWERAARRAEQVAAQLAPDPQHSALIYLPGRLDPRNCSNSVIDSGECTDALARLLLHERAATLPAERRARLCATVEQNAETYLRTAVVEKEIPNQRLWGAMGLASACRLVAWVPSSEFRVPSRVSAAPQVQAPSVDRAETTPAGKSMDVGLWKAAIAASVARSIDEQGEDGSWGYQPEAARDGAFPGAADLTVYYHSRCLAFLLHILDCVPEIDSRRLDLALRRGLEFLAAVITPDGLKPLALEGKRWFWNGSYEAGSNAYDVFALVRGAGRYGMPEWIELARRSWAQLARHQRPDGGLLACAERQAHDFVCRDFHTADLAWPAQVLDSLPAPVSRSGSGGHQPRGQVVAQPASPAPSGHRVQYDRPSGVLRLESPAAVALIRTSKRPLNTQFGGAVGGGALAYVGDRETGDSRLVIDRESPLVEGNLTLYPAQPSRLRAAIRFLRHNPPGREGRQWLFVARLLLAQRQPLAAITRLWSGYLRPLIHALADPAATHWALTSDVDVEAATGGVRITCQPARQDGTVPAWASDVVVVRRYGPAEGGLQMVDQVSRNGAEPGGAGRCARLVYLVPERARDVRVTASEPVDRREPAGRRVELRPTSDTFSLRVTYLL